MTSAVDLFEASVFRDADFITLGELDDSPGVAVFLGKFLDQSALQCLYFDAASRAKAQLTRGMWLLSGFCCRSLQSLSIQRRYPIGKLDDGLEVFLGMLDGKQLFLLKRLYFDAASKARLVLSVSLV
jgi:hypothetical protein